MSETSAVPRGIDRDTLIIASVISGKTLAEIGEQFGVSRQAIYQIVQRIYGPTRELRSNWAIAALGEFDGMNWEQVRRKCLRCGSTSHEAAKRQLLCPACGNLSNACAQAVHAMKARHFSQAKYIIAKHGLSRKIVEGFYDLGNGADVVPTATEGKP